MRFHGWIVLAVLLAATIPAMGQQATPAKVKRVGEVKIVGNTVTYDRVIRSLLNIYPGQVLDYQDLQQAERNLISSHLFTVDRKKGIRPVITVITDPNFPDAEFLDVMVQVQERESGIGRFFWQLYWRIRTILN